MNIYIKLPIDLREIVGTYLDKHIYEQLHKPLQNFNLELLRNVYEDWDILKGNWNGTPVPFPVYFSGGYNSPYFHTRRAMRYW